MFEMAGGDDLPSDGRESATLNNNQQENIKVAVRIRPFTEKERQRNNRRILDIEQNTVVLYSPRHGDVSLKRFTFDYSYWSHDGFKRDASGVNTPDPTHPNCDKYVGQEKVFEDLGKFLLDNALQGYNSALLAYGQTGSGKSYTVSGYGQNEGILPRFARALFEELSKKAKVLERTSNQDSSSSVKVSPDSSQPSNPTEPEALREGVDNTCRYEVFFSMIEIYNEVVRDLLAKNHGELVTQTTFVRRNLKVREHPKHGFFVENLTSYPCADKDEIERRIEEGQLNKSIAATSMNETSSRGHTIYEFKIKQYKLKSPESPEEILTTSVVQLVDLAGSERMAVHVTGQLGSDTFIGSRSDSPFPTRQRNNDKQHLKSGRARGAPTSASSSVSTVHQASTTHKQRFKESVSINQSLSALGNCIQVLSQYSQQLESNVQLKKAAPKIPYRDSVLTKLLNRCCLSGNSKVVIIATLSPADTNYDDTLSTLRFADRAKQIRTHATINRMSRTEMVDTLQKENERLKQMVDGRVTRSDDSSQTSNFDDSENIIENFTGSKIGGKSTKIDTVATPNRNRTTVRKTRDDRQSQAKKPKRKSPSRLTSSTSNPSLVAREQMKRLVSPASRELVKDNRGEARSIQKSRSIGQDLAVKLSGGSEESGGEEFDAELSGIDNAEGINEVDLNDIKEGLISPDSEDSYSALADEDLSTEEKIGIFNRLLSNSTANNQIKRGSKKQKSPSKLERPKRANGLQAEMKQVSVLSSSLKKSNPYLSNLNPDEQLTGMLSYIIKKGETILGKNNACDVVLHGPELRGQHAKITRVPIEITNEDDQANRNLADQEEDAPVPSNVYIEPIFDTPLSEEEQNNIEKNVALMVNGSPITRRTSLNHCDRLLFGTNAYFVFIDSSHPVNSASDTVADLDLITFEMAQNEVLRKVMAEAKNEAMIKEINDYTHRPGTGKHKVKADESRARSLKDTNMSEGCKLNRSMTVHEKADQLDELSEELKKVSTSPKTESAETTVTANEEKNHGGDVGESSGIEASEEHYRDQLMEDTYEYAMPVAEVNAVAKEMGIKVEYGLKILTGEEQIPEQMMSGYVDSNTSDGLSSSSMGENDQTSHQSSDDRVTRMTKLDGLDIPPALYIKVHLEELGLDFYWTKEKFQARRYKILELYGPWDVGGKSGLVEHLIDQSKTLGDYLIDPFVDEPSTTFVLIGHAQITLQPISHLADMKQSYDIIDLNDENAGNITIEAIPCHPEVSKSEKTDPYIPFSEDDLANNLLDDPKDLLNKKLVFLLKLISCRDIPDKYTNVFCQYSLVPDSPSVRTKALREDSIDSENSFEENHGELTFNHTHFISLGTVTRDTLDFLEHGFLTIQVVGQYKLSADANRSPTVVSTIINSINKYKFKMEQQNNSNGMSYPSSVYYNSNSDSANSKGGQSSGLRNSNSGASSVASTSTTVNMFDQQNEDEEGMNAINGLSQENIIDMILTKRKLDRAENQLHYLKRTVNIAEHYNKKHIPVKTVKKLLNSYGQSGSTDDLDAPLPRQANEPKPNLCRIS